MTRFGESVVLEARIPARSASFNDQASAAALQETRSIDRPGLEHRLSSQNWRGKAVGLEAIVGPRLQVAGWSGFAVKFFCKQLDL
jgi:hypothetical protein